MKQIVLKVPPRRVALMAEALENWADNNPDLEQVNEIDEIVTWLRYRLSRWQSSHPVTPGK
jgi:hypothetical protein